MKQNNERRMIEQQRITELDVDRLPLPELAIDLMKRNHASCPITKKDFDRVNAYFRSQVAYYEDEAAKANDPVTARLFRSWGARIPDLYELIRSNVRVITKQSFEAVLPSMRSKIEGFVQGEHFLCFLHGKDMDEAKKHSTFYVASQLGISEDRCITEADLQRSDIQTFILNGGKIVIVDDAAFTGSNLKLHLNAIEDIGYKIQPYQVLLSLVGITKKANSIISEWDIPVQITAELRIPDVGELFEVKDGVDDYRILRFMKREGYNGRREQIMVHNDQVLTMFWQKVPDNFVKALRKVDNRWWDGDEMQYWDGFLVDDTPDGIHPGYRNGETFSHS